MYSVYTSTINKASIPVYPVNTFEAPVSNSIVTDIDTRQTKGYKNHQVDHIDVSDTNEHKQNSQGDDGTNEPHPALEYSLFYHMLRLSPRLLQKSLNFYQFRWNLSYKLQRNVYLPRVFGKNPIQATWAEIILIIPFLGLLIVGLVYSIIFPSVVVSGKIARYALIGALLFAQRNSLVTLIFGMSVDRTIYYHKLSGKLGGAMGLLHTVSYFIDPKFQQKYGSIEYWGLFSDQINISGCIMLLLLLGISISSLPIVRRNNFEVFYNLHFVFVSGLIIGAFFHSGRLVPFLAFFTWGIDLFIRKVIMVWTLNPKIATLSTISETVIQLSFPKTKSFAYNPGQYIYVSIPEISWLEWHPFSMSSSPNQQIVTLHIRKAGNWTSALYKLANAKSQVHIFLEGPYGSLSVDILGDRKYKNVLLISGGIGITPMQSICDQLLMEKSEGLRDLRNLKFVWIERDPRLVEQVDIVKKIHKESDSPDKLTTSQNINQVFSKEKLNSNLSAALLAIPHPDQTTDKELDALYDCESLSADPIPKCIECSGFDFDDNTIEYDDLSNPSAAAESWMSEKVFDLQVYLTGNLVSIDCEPYTRHGRPDIKAIFDEMRLDAMKSGEKKVAVCVSAPKQVMRLCQKACHLSSDYRVRFDFHSETISF